MKITRPYYAVALRMLLIAPMIGLILLELAADLVAEVFKRIGAFLNRCQQTLNERLP